MTGVQGMVVGYDGSADSEHAVSWAVDEARARACELTVCLAWPRYPAPAKDAAFDDEARRAGEHVLARGLKLARDLLGEHQVHPLLAGGSAATILCERSAGAQLVVLGARGRGGLPDLPLGSVSIEVAAHARGPVAVIRGRWAPVPGHLPGPVVVGTEGSPGSQTAVTFAFEEAALRRTYLLAVCALADAAGVLGGEGQIRDDFEQLIAEREHQYPDVPVRRQVSEGTARQALLDAAADGQMLVVGSRGRGGLRGMPLGSVSLAVLGYAPCPVVIARSHDEG